MAWLFAMPMLTTASVTPAPLPLSGTALERPLGGGEAHRYQVVRRPGEMVWLRVAQHGIDVVVSLLDADGTPRRTVDSPSSFWGEEVLLISAPDAAGAVVEIRALAPMSAPGRYVLRVARDVEPPSADALATRRAARYAASEAGRLYHLGTPDHRTRARDLYRQALDSWRQLDRSDEVAQTLFLLGMAERGLGAPREALPLLRQAHALWRDQGDRRGQARAGMEIATTARMAGEVAALEDAYVRALDDWRAVGDLQGQARALNFVGLARSRTAPATALAPYEAALRLFRQVGDAFQEGVVLSNIGGLHSMLGEPHQALEHYRLALASHRHLGNRQQEATVLNNIAAVHTQTGRLQAAIDGFQASLALRRALDDANHGERRDVRGEARVLNNLGSLWRRLGDAARARDHLEQALTLRRVSSDRRGEATTLHNLALVHAEQGDAAASLDAFREALSLRQNLGDRAGEATTLVALARVAHTSGRPAEARRHLERAMPLLDALGNPWHQAGALRILGEVATTEGALVEAVEHLHQALGHYRAAGDQVGVGDTLLALARAERKRDGPEALRHLRQAYDHAVVALDLLETVRADVDSLDLRASFLAHHSDAFGLGVALAMDLHRAEPAAGWAARALELHERSRARSLLDLLTEVGAGVRHDVDPALLARQQTLTERFNANVARQRRNLGRTGDAVGNQASKADLHAIEVALEGVENAIRRQSRAWRALAPSQPFQAPALQALLDPDTLLLAYALGDEKSLVWVVTVNDIVAHPLPPRTELEAAARAFHDTLRTHDPRARATGARLARRLSDLILGPVAHRLGSARLAIVPDGALHFVPFAALPRPITDGASDSAPEPLLVRHEIVSLPSASALGLQRQLLAHRPTATGRIAVVADPVFDQADPRLSNGGSSVSRRSPTPAQDTRMREAPHGRLDWSRWEAQAIAHHLGKGEATLALDFDANLDDVLGGGLRGHDIVHFATHGVIDSEHPALSALVLSLLDADGRPRPGHLRLPDILNLRLDADLVVLSGCRTALGAEMRGEGLVGLTRGFFAAGARRLVASLWRVQDRSTADLMDHFYRRLLTDDQPTTPAAALRAAQLALRDTRGYDDPYHWAAFVAYGDWR